MIQLAIGFDEVLSQRAIVDRVSELAARAELGTITKYKLNKHAAWVAGDRKKLVAEIESGKHSDHITRAMFSTGLELTMIAAGESGWTIDSNNLDAGAKLLALGCRLAEVAFSDPEHPASVVKVEHNNVPKFVPHPAIAESYVALVTNDREVANNYDDPAVFWAQWRVVARADGEKLCLRATDKVDMYMYLGETYEGTLAMVRAAKPKKSSYGSLKRWPEAYRAFWEMGSFDDECAGMPALRRVGYDAKTKTLEYAGMISKTEDEHRHVMLKEIGELANFVDAKRDAEGRALAHVRVVFPEAWMAQQEKRPLLDLGIEVYFTGKGGELVAVPE